MPGAVAEGKYFDVKKPYNHPDPPRSYVSQTAQNLSYSTTFINRGAGTILVEYDWYISLSTEPLERLDKDEFVLAVNFYDLDRGEAIDVDENNIFELTPVGESRTLEVQVNVEMYFAKVDELMDPRLKDSTLLVTIDLRRMWELTSGGYLEVVFDTDDDAVEGTLTPEDPIEYTKQFAYTSDSSYLADVSWWVEDLVEPLASNLFNMTLKFINMANMQELVPDNGKISIPANSTIEIQVELSLTESAIQTRPELLVQKLYVNIAVGTAP
ncbi:MAG: hypothetical protein EOM87_07575 [Clostridia bacterium]|nr:hypothetical protein [Clostridia bacterium]